MIGLITNLYTDPSCLKQYPTWNSSSTATTTITQSGTNWTYAHTGGGSWAIMPKDRMELMKPGYVVVIAYTATDEPIVSVENSTAIASGTTPSGVTWQAAKINKDDGHSIYCLHDGSMTLKAMAVYEADEWPTVQQLLPPISMVQRRNDAPAVIGGERR